MSKEGSDGPSPTADIDRWRQIISNDGLSALAMGEIVAGIQDLGPDADKRVLNPMMLYLSDELTRLLRKRVSRKHLNQGKDIIERAHAAIIEAVLKPNSADGKGLREAFRARVEFRLVDAINAEREHARRHPSSDEHEDGDGPSLKRERAEEPVAEGQAYVEGLLAHIDDPRKLLAWRLYMEEVPIESKKGASIAKAVGVSGRTIHEWIEETRELLKSKIGDRA